MTSDVPRALQEALQVVSGDLHRPHPSMSVVWEVDDRGDWWVSLLGEGYDSLEQDAFDGDEEFGQPLISWVADATQEMVMAMEGLVWPVCILHDLGLHANIDHLHAVWTCSASGGHVVGPVGKLA